MTKTLPGVSRLIRASVLDSTQTTAKELAQNGVPSGTLIWAARQTAGRGRLDRPWDSAAGGLYFSLILRPSFPPSRLARFSLGAAHAVSDALWKKAGAAARVVFPNDVYAEHGGRWKKIAGLLTEARGGERTLSWLIVGIGVNVNNAPRLESAVSLKQITGQTWDPEDILEEILLGLEGLRG